MKIFKKKAEFFGYTLYHGEKINEWRCPKCGLGITEEYRCCPYCCQKIKFPNIKEKTKMLKIAVKCGDLN